MSDVIRIQGLRAKTRIGVTDDERASDQVVVIDLHIETDLQAAGVSDDLADTIDYDATVSQVAALVRSSESHLLEHLGEQIAALVGDRPGVQRVSVEIRKEETPVDEDVGAIVVRIVRPKR